MAHPPTKLLVMSSVLDRLFDDAPQAAQEPPFESRFDLGRHKLAVARDLEALLNARSLELELDLAERFPLAGGSMLAFGIPDLSSLSLLNPDHRALLQRQILHTIERFEPRLDQVRVELDGPMDCNRMLRFRVEAVLRVHPHRPPVVFDAVLKLSSNACRVRSQI
jgi:type VI secretion system protein ImpF